MKTSKQSARDAVRRGAFQISPVAAGCAALVWSFSGGAVAQTAPTAAPADTVVVTGIRKGIEDAISVKKNADSIVEAISAEDIGKLPDTTVAESLARLPGVTTQRTRDGNASTISIRGLGPDFNGYLLNGREQSGTGDSRAADLSVYPAELISGATVYKSADAALVTAGLAGTIDNRLIDPLAFGSRVIQGSVERTRTGISLPVEGAGHRKSLTYIDQFADRTVGVALGFVRVDGTTNEIGTGGWGGQDNATATLKDGTVVTGVKIPGPWGGGLDFKNRRLSDERNGVAAIIDYKPSKDFASQIDFYSAKIKTVAHEARIQGGLPNSFTNAVLDGTNTAVSGTFNFPSSNLGEAPTGIIDRTESVFDDDKLLSFGWKNTLKFGNGWTGVLDLSRNSAKRVERDIEAYAGTRGATSLNFVNDGSGTPKLSFSDPTVFTDPAKVQIRDQTGWSGIGGVPQAGYSKGPTITDKVSALRFDLSHAMPEGSMFSDVQFGGNFTKRTKDRVTDEGLIVSDTQDGHADIPFPSDAYIAKNVGGTGLDMLTFDPKADLWPGATILRKYNNDILSKTWGVEEKVLTAYAKFNIDSELGGRPLRGNLGVQLVNTDQSSSGYRADIGSDVVLQNPATTLSTDGKKYNNLLPSLNLASDLGNGNVLRFAASEQLARSNMTDLRNSFAASQDNDQSHLTTYGHLVGSAGNPQLSPFRAKALDLSYEKYFGKKAYVSGAAFYKRLDTYIVPQTDVAYDFTNAATALGIPLPLSGTYIGQFTTNVNGSGGNLKGLELSASAPFNLLTSWLDGFGVTGSYSNTTSSVRLPNIIGQNPTQPVPNDGKTIPLPGLSKTNTKLTLYFEKWGFSAFVAENLRSQYVGSVANDAIGGYPTLKYIAAQRWVSAQVGYEVQDGYLKGLGLRVEGNNLNNPVYRQLKEDGSTDSSNKTGHTIIVRLNYKFQ